MPKLWERDVVLGAIDRRLRATREGHGGGLFVVGEAGLGKSSVLQVALALASSDFRVGLGRGDAMETSLAFGVLLQALEALGASDLLTSGPQVPNGDVRASRFYGLHRWLETVSDPVLLAFDDLQWADRDSVDVLAFLLRRTANLKVAVIGTLRPWPAEARPTVSSLVHGGYATLERLAPLSATAARDLLTDQVGRSCEESVARSIWVMCAGNPLLLQEAGRTLARGERIPDPSSGDRSELSRELLLARFGMLSPAAIRLARAACVSGNRFRLDVAAEVTGLSDAEVMEASEALYRSGLIVGGVGETLEFIHPLFRQALYDDLGPAALLQLHRSVFRALSKRGLETEAAEHAVRGGLVGDSRATGLLERVGRRALEAGALEAASDHLAAAVLLAGEAPPSRLLLAQGEALLARGRADQALGILERLRKEPNIELYQRIQALRLLGRARFALGEPTRAGTSFEEAEGLALASGDSGAAVEIMLDHALAGWLLSGPRGSLSVAVQARRHAADVAPAVRRRADAAWGLLSLQSGDASGFEAIASAAEATVDTDAPDLAELTFVWGPLSLYALSAVVVERFDVSLRFGGMAIEAAERVGAVEGLAWHYVTHALTLFRLGRLADALKSILRAQMVSEHLVAPPLAAHIAIAGSSALLQLGRVEESDEWAARAEQLAGPRGNLSLVVVWDVRGQRLLHLGRGSESADIYAHIMETVDRAGLRDPSYCFWARHAIFAHLSRDGVPDARRVVGWLEECASGLPSRWPMIAAATGRAWLAERAGDERTAEGEFEAALALHQEVDLPLEKVETLLAWGGYLRRAGRTASARSVLLEAWRLAESLGTRWLAEQAAEELGVAGGRRRRGHDPLELTPQEGRVRRLAASGLSNREIAGQLSVSENTVETHLQRVYSKLGVRSRRELMTARDLGNSGNP